MISSQILIEAVIKWLNKMKENDDFLKTTGLMGEYGENQSIPLSLCAIEKTDTVNSSNVGYDMMDNIIYRLKIEDHYVAITAYASIKEEADRIIEKYVDKIETTLNIPTSNEIKIIEVGQTIKTSSVGTDKLNGEKMFSRKLVFDIRTNDLITINAE